MAGRGTDIVLGPGIAQKGGLHVIGTERHESRRIDNQLRGRAGRQGDPGSSRFYLSLEDDLMRIFGSDRIANVMGRLGLEDGQDIQHPLITRAISSAQKKVENHHFEIRKWLLKYDDVMNKQREVIYNYRDTILDETNFKNFVLTPASELLNNIISKYYDLQGEEEVDYKGLSREILENFHIITKPEEIANITKEEFLENCVNYLEKIYNDKHTRIDQETFIDFLRWKFLDIVDRKWKDHLYGMDELRESVGLRAFGQKDPLIEYQHEGHKIFAEMILRIENECVKEFYSMPIIHVDKEMTKQEHFNISEMLHPDFHEQGPFIPINQEQPQNSAQEHHKGHTFVRDEKKVGRNEDCPCGSGKKYKKCCGA